MVSALDSGLSGPGSGPGRDIVLCSWARHFTFTVPLSTQEHKMGTGEFNARGNPAMDWHPIQGGVEILLVAPCYRNWISPGLMGHLARKWTLPFFVCVMSTCDFEMNSMS